MNSAVGYRSNTNLEQISDWLTKILVGVGLTQFASIWRYLRIAGAYVGPSISLESVQSQAAADQSARSLAVLIVVAFSVSGFFYTYLWTILILIGRMTEAERESTAARERKAEQADIDAIAIAMTDATLRGSAIPDPKQLRETLERASADAKQLIYYRAIEIRRNTWRSDKLVMQRTIPIFEALVALDVRNEFPDIRAQLAYTLRDKQTPSTADLQRALDLFNTAIRLRNERGDTNPYYEFNRAMCRIALDPTSTGESQPPLRDQILNDLKASSGIAAIAIADNSGLAAWLERNQVKLENLSQAA